MNTIFIQRPRDLIGTIAACAATLMTFLSQPSIAQPNPVLNPTAIATTQKAVSKAKLARLAKEREWHKTLIHTPLPRGGCFKAEYPRPIWREISCALPPNVPMSPRHGDLPYTVGNGYGYSAEVPGRLLGATGSFDKVTTTGEAGFTYQSPSTAVPDAYTLQLNSNQFDSPACAGSAAPGNCRGWQQFVYSSKSTQSAFMQYWLLNHGTPCPTGWIHDTSNSDGNCYRSSSSIPVSLIPATSASLEQTSLTASVTTGGDDRLDLATGSTHYAVTNSDNVLSLSNGWNTAEFAVLGDCCGHTAYFSANTEIALRITVHDGTTNAPTCVLEGFTGEKNNLNLVNTPAIGTQASPTLISNQTNIGTPIASCAVAAGIGDTHLRTFTPAQPTNAAASSLSYDFQAEGEFILARTDIGFEVQTRQISGAPTWPNATINQAIAAKIGKSIIVFSAASNNPEIFIDGSPIILFDGQRRLLSNDGDILRQNNTYFVRDLHGNSVQIIVQEAATSYLDVYVGLGRWPTKVQGLLANATDNVSAVAARDGTIFVTPFNFSSFYSTYGDSWRVKENESLFASTPLRLPELKIANPAQPFDASHLTKAIYLKAKKHCLRAGVTNFPISIVISITI